MNWKRAKTFLIMMFLVVDIMLLYIYEINRPITVVNSTEEEISQCMQSLKQMDVRVQCVIPKKAYQRSDLKITYKHFQPEEVIAPFFLGDNFEQTEEKKRTVIENKTFRSVIHASGLLNFTNKAYREGELGEEKRFITQVFDFLQRLKIEKKSVVVDKIIRSGNEYIFYGKQTYRDMPILKTTIEIVGSSEEIHQASILICDSMKPQKEGNPTVITATQALRAVAENRRNSNTGAGVVLDVEQGYYFTNQDIQSVDVVAIQQSRAYLVWKVVLEDGIVYVNAFSGNLEKPTEETIN